MASIGKVKFIGDDGIDLSADILDGHIYDVISIEAGNLRIVCEDGEDYLYSAIYPYNVAHPEKSGYWEIIEDPEGKIRALCELKKKQFEEELRRVEQIYIKKNNSNKNKDDFDER